MLIDVNPYPRARLPPKPPRPRFPKPEIPWEAVDPNPKPDPDPESPERAPAPAAPATPLMTTRFCGAPRLAVFPLAVINPALFDPTRLAPVPEAPVDEDEEDEEVVVRLDQVVDDPWFDPNPVDGATFPG